MATAATQTSGTTGLSTMDDGGREREWRMAARGDGEGEIGAGQVRNRGGGWRGQ
ncbi:hypothetical protein Syun_003254 [Stephania yunnanensis]|uniref:Uncharacterized protein n=1 Tax=Stephania yunnanensis TaxID=152371 RepID=A0AAP0PZP7_9MAGN